MFLKKTDQNNNIFFRSFINNGINTVFTFIFGIISSILFTRIYGIEIFGSFTLIASYITIFFSIVTLGILSGFKREAIWFVSNNKNIGGYIFLVYIFSILFSIIPALPIYFFSDYFFDFFDISKNLLNPLIFYFIIHIVFFVPASIFLYVFEAYQDIFPITYINFFSNLLKLISVIIVGYFLVNIYSGILVYFLVSNLIILILSLHKLVIKYQIKFDITLIKKSIKNFFNAIKFSIKLLPLTISEIILANLGLVLLGKYNDIESVGYFKILLIFYVLLNFIPIFFVKVLSPMITKFFFEKNFDQILKYYNIIFKISMSISIPAIIIFGFFTEQALLMYDIQSQYLIYCMWILLLTNVFLIGSLLGSVFSAYNKPKLISLFLVSGSLINLILSYLLIPIYGIMGACLSLLISNIITQFSMHFYAIHIMNFQIPLVPIYKNLINGFFLISFFYLSGALNSTLLLKLGLAILGLLLFVIISSYNNIFTKSDFDSFNKIIDQIINVKIRIFLKKLLVLFFRTKMS